MSIHYKLILPLLISNLTLEDLDPNEGFIGAFSYDINRPFLDNHIFLVYDTIPTPKSIERIQRFKKCPNYYNKRFMIVKGIHFLCFAFVISQPIIKKIQSNLLSDINENELLRIYKFWKFTDEDLNKYMVSNKIDIFSETKYEVIPIPEEDYIPQDEE